MASIEMVAIDCVDTRRQATFWAAALNTTVTGDYGDFVMLAPTAPGRPAVGLQRVPEPKVSKSRTHLDLAATDRHAEVARLVELGATVTGEGDAPGFEWTVLADPEGTEFCVGQPVSDNPE